jgi:hypothetical protein
VWPVEEETMKEYGRSTSGRLMGLAFSLMFGAGAISVLSGMAYVWSATAILMVFLALVAGVGCAMLGVEEYPVQTVLALILMPIGGLLYVPMMGAVLPQIPESSYVLAALAAAGLAIALRPGKGEEREPHRAPVHATGH